MLPRAAQDDTYASCYGRLNRVASGGGSDRDRDDRVGMGLKARALILTGEARDHSPVLLAFVFGGIVCPETIELYTH